MDIKKMLELYGIDKVGLSNENKRMCACGTELSLEDKTCPNCNTPIKKTKLLNVNKNSALGKRYEGSQNGDVCSFKYYQLLSNGFELYETEMLDFSINCKTADVRISNSKVFKTIDKTEAFGEFLNTYLNGFSEFVYSCLGEFRYEYAVSNFTSLSESQLSNFVHTYFNYKALIPYLRGYKIFYYGRKINLKKYYPNVDFNNIDEVKKTNLNLDLLLSWDIKNEKYIESIIEISENENANTQRVLSDILYSMLNDRRSSETYENTINSFSLLYNKEISLEDFIRIYNNSRDNYFNQIFEFRKLHKKLVSKTIDWSTIEKIDRKTIGTLKTKEHLKADMKLSKANIESAYELLEKDPFKSLIFLAENSKN